MTEHRFFEQLLRTPCDTEAGLSASVTPSRASKCRAERSWGIVQGLEQPSGAHWGTVKKLEQLLQETWRTSSPLMSSCDTERARAPGSHARGCGAIDSSVSVRQLPTKPQKLQKPARAKPRHIEYEICIDVPNACWMLRSQGVGHTSFQELANFCVKAQVGPGLI